ncbi:MAG: TadE/TadG family type IV pilus assembly protein [Planctomycetota bacterium]|jgi:Flp pilus assembly protein TadG
MKALKRVPQSGSTSRTRAAAIVEFAVVSPLLLVILFGIIEYGYVFMVQQTLTNAAREGCRVAVLQTTTEPYTEVVSRVAEVMGPTGQTTYTVTMTHANPPTVTTEAVTVSIPFEDVSLVGSFFGQRNGDLSGTCSMRKEGV